LHNGDEGGGESGFVAMPLWTAHRGSMPDTATENISSSGWHRTPHSLLNLISQSCQVYGQSVKHFPLGLLGS
jgi:hypothetical protein